VTAQLDRVDDSSGRDPELAGRRILILGAGLWQREYVRRARELGLETWVTDWSPTAVARGDADHFDPIDLKDREATLALARRARVDAVLTAADIGVPTAAYVAEQLGLPGHSTALSTLATNKFAMRERSRALGIPCPRYQRVRCGGDAARVDDELLPAIVKPVDNCSSRGVRWVERRAALPPAIEGALSASRDREALVEEFLVGREGSVEALVQDGRAIVLGICDKTKSPLPDRFDVELRYPGDWDSGVWSGIEALAQRIASGFEIANGILHIEFLVSADTRAVYLIEFAIRGCGSKVATHLMPVLTGVDVVRIVIRQAAGLSSRIEPLRAAHGALHFLLFRPGRIVAVHGVDAARRLPGVIDAVVERVSGETIGEVHDGRSRPGHVLASGASRGDVQRTIAAVRRAVRIDYEDARDVPPLDPGLAADATS
jgi:biotin carboxylase